MVDIKDTKYSSIDNLVFEKFKNDVIDVLNMLETNHFTLFLSNGAEIDINYKECLVSSYPEEKKVVKIEQ